MCGIIGYIGKNKALEVIIEGLERLEYRGYDSAGIAYAENNKIKIVKEKGKIVNLKQKLDFNIKSNIGIGHTRWATHGIPNNTNSHPHNVGKITIVHNGIIENYEQLKKNELKDYKFKSTTDTEVACALLDKLYKQTNSMEQAISIFKQKVIGAYAIGIICSDDLNNLYAIKKESPLIIGIGKDENFIASDVPAILKYTNNYITLEDGDFAKISNTKIYVYNKKDEIVKKTIKTFGGDSNDVGKCGYDHYMLKEIHEEPTVIKNTVLPFLENGSKSLVNNFPDLNKFKNIDIVACGSAMHAGYVGKYLIEKFANIPVTIDIASEFRYKPLFLDKKSLLIAISQSGETADTLAAVKLAKQNKVTTLGIINVIESTIARTTDKVLYTKAGTEIAVATTKAYVAQVTLLSLLALRMNKLLPDKDVTKVIKDYNKLPNYVDNLIGKDIYSELATKMYKQNNIFFIGRNIDYALAMEGALKLKEISYINAQAYAAGELKHGSISLINRNTPVVAIVTDKDIAGKTISNIKEVKARGAYVILIITESLDVDDNFYDQKIVIPDLNDFVNPILAIVPLQLMAYEVAKLKKCDIDKPKNLAKSVTVE